MTVALVLTVATVVLIVAYLDRLAHGLQVGEVVRTIAGEADGVLDAAVRESRTENPGGGGAPAGFRRDHDGAGGPGRLGHPGADRASPRVGTPVDDGAPGNASRRLHPSWRSAAARLAGPGQCRQAPSPARVRGGDLRHAHDATAVHLGESVAAEPGHHPEDLARFRPWPRRRSTRPNARRTEPSRVTRATRNPPGVPARIPGRSRYSSVPMWRMEGPPLWSVDRPSLESSRLRSRWTAPSNASFTEPALWVTTIGC